MIIDTNRQWMHTFGTGATTSHFRVPYASKLKDFQGTAGADIGDAQTLTVTRLADSVALGVLTFGSGIAAGAIGTWVADATTGETVLAKDDILLVTGSAGAAGAVAIDAEFDPFAL